MDRIYDAAQQGLLACVTAGEQEVSLTGFLMKLRSDGAWSSGDVDMVEKEIRRLLSLGEQKRPPRVLSYRGKYGPIAASKSNSIVPNG